MTPVLSLDAYPVAEQPDTLDRAALTFCLGGPFHPGCEMTWPMRVASHVSREVPAAPPSGGFTDPDYGDFLNQVTVLGDSGPLSASGPGDLTKWMSVPWHADTASCLQGYPGFETAQGGPFNVDPYLPTFWAPRAPNEVLTDGDYQIVMDTTQPLADRIAAFNRRRDWTRNLFQTSTPWIEQLTNMVEFFGTMGVIEKRPGIDGDPNFPSEMYVETLADLVPLATPERSAQASRATLSPAISCICVLGAGGPDDFVPGPFETRLGRKRGREFVEIVAEPGDRRGAERLKAAVRPRPAEG